MEKFCPDFSNNLLARSLLVEGDDDLAAVQFRAAGVHAELGGPKLALGGMAEINQA